MITRTIHSMGPLSGTLTVPGDRRIMLMALALGMVADGPVRIENLPPERWYAPFLTFLQRYGAKSELSDNGMLTFRGHAWSEEVRITAEVPTDVLHVVAATVACTGRRIVFEKGASDRADEITLALDLLAGWGLDQGRTVTDDGDVVIENAACPDDDTSVAPTGQAAEVALAVSRASGRQVTVSYAPQTAAHIIKLAERLGCTVATPESSDTPDRDHELSRRLARVKGGKALTTASFSWDSVLRGVIVLPGDATVAAAVAGVGALVPRSKVTIRGVVWEQDRRGFYDILKRMKGAVSWETTKRPSVFDTADITIQWAPLEGIHVTAEQSLAMRSEVILLASVAATAADKSVVSVDAGSLVPGRQACRLAAAGLTALGAHAGDFEAGIVLNGVPELRGSNLDAAGNTEAALALSVAALTAAGKTSLNGIEPDMPYIEEFFTAIESLSASSLSLS